MIRLHYPYSCPDCGGTILGTLSSDPETPYYSCGRVGRGKCPRTLAPVDPNPDLVELTDADWDDLVSVVGTVPMDPSEFRSFVRVELVRDRIGECEVMHCGATAIDGRCMEHYIGGDTA